MQIGFHLSNLYRFVRITPLHSDIPAAIPQSPTSPDDITQSGLNTRRVARLGQALNELDELFTRARPRQGADKASAISPTLNLVTNQTATTLESAEEINVATTSYTPYGPVFAGSGASDALPTLSGVYDGSNGDDTLRFEVTRTGIHGITRIRVKVYDSGDNELDALNIRANHPIDREYSLSNGLIFTLGEGSLIDNDTFYLDVYADTPTTADPDKPFNGIRNERPDFDHGTSVTSGSFDVNGVTIDVNADDTINTVLSRINASAADVDAVFDEVADTVTLSRRQAGSAFGINLANDSSGFLAATKLTGAATPGQDREADIALNQTQRFSDVSNGGLLINGQNFGIDVVTDSLSGIVAAINDADIGVTASLVHGGQRLLFSAATAGTDITLDDQGTGFFDALGLQERTYSSRARNGFSRTRSYRIADAVTNAANTINEIFDPSANPRRSAGSLIELQDSILSALRAGAPTGDNGSGIAFATDSIVRARLVRIDRRALVRGLRNNAGAAQGYLGDLIGSLRGAVSGYAASYPDIGSGAGLMLNTRA